MNDLRSEGFSHHCPVVVEQDSEWEASGPSPFHNPRSKCHMPSWEPVHEPLPQGRNSRDIIRFDNDRQKLLAGIIDALAPLIELVE